MKRMRPTGAYRAYWHRDEQAAQIVCLPHSNPWLKELPTKESAQEATMKHFWDGHMGETWSLDFFEAIDAMPPDDGKFGRRE
jgi:hypothetical protein